MARRTKSQRAHGPAARKRRGTSVGPFTEPAESAKDAAFFTHPATGARRCRDDPISETRERQGLKNDASGAGELNEEQPFPTEQRCLDARHALNVVVDRRLQRDETAGVDTQHFTGNEIDGVQRARRMEKREAIARELLQNEAFSAKEARADAFRECHGDINAARRAEK